MAPFFIVIAIGLIVGSEAERWVYWKDAEVDDRLFRDVDGIDQVDYAAALKHSADELDCLRRYLKLLLLTLHFPVKLIPVLLEELFYSP